MLLLISLFVLALSVACQERPEQPPPGTLTNESRPLTENAAVQSNSRFPNFWNPCAAVFCDRGTICSVQQLPCFRPPCQQRAVCVSPCHNINCGRFQTCQVDPFTSRARCVDNGFNVQPCQRLRCDRFEQCVERPDPSCRGRFCRPVATCIRRSRGRDSDNSGDFRAEEEEENQTTPPDFIEI